jgi:diadenosine tetraphosphatase ApaH/serine/threonine PP2A family protein phosphatase
VRTALISDVHANLAALEAVLADIEHRGVDRIVSLGDIVGYGPDPVACVDLVASRCEWSLMGNHDFGVLYEPTNFNAAAEQAANWSREQIEAEARRDPEGGGRRLDYLNRLRVRVLLEPGILCVHGSPRRPINEYLFPDDAINSPAKMEAVFDRIDHACIVGHTHVPGVFTDDPDFLRPEEFEGRFRLEAGHKVVINPGSVGQPRDLDPRASYAILETGDGLPVVEFHRCEYEVAATVAKIKSIPQLHDWLGDRLLEGR